MPQTFRARKGLQFPVRLPNGAVLGDPGATITGDFYAQYSPVLLEKVEHDDAVRMITEDMPETTPNPVIVEEPIDVPEQVETIVPQEEIKQEVLMEETPSEPKPVKLKTPRTRKPKNP